MDDSRAAVIEAYRAILGRDPENEDAMQASMIKPMAKMIHDIAHSPEAAQKKPAFSPLSYYACSFDANEVMQRHARQDIEPDSEFVTNFLGVKIEEVFFKPMLEGRSGTVEPIPDPANWHADVAEWAAALRAVDLTRSGTFIVAELGCGWGCWINNTGVAARAQRKKPVLIGVEGDEGHIAFAWRCCNHNGFYDQDVTIHHGIAASKAGTALFPRQYAPGGSWGLEPVFGADEKQTKDAIESKQWDVLRMFTLDEIIGDNPCLDLLHMDIQGSEADFIEQFRELLDRRVAYIVIGTHSRMVEGRIIKALEGHPWRLEMERPALVSLEAGGPVTRIDGVQGWRNMALRPGG